MRVREIQTYLSKHGCFYVRQAKGSHEIWRGPNGKTTLVAGHGILPRGTVIGICKSLGLPYAM